MKKIMMLVLALLIVLPMTGCIKPYDEPEYVEIESYETAFMLPMQGKTSEQLKFASEEYLAANQVATKRVRILHQWVQTGRGSWNGKYIPTHKVIKVNRRPVTREWVAEANKGTGNKDEAIWVESRDSVGFSVGFNCTAMIEADNAAKFLYTYASTSLATVMDSEIRARIQAKAAEICAEYDMDELRAKKGEIIQAVRDDILPYYQDRGITVTAIGMFGGFTYENPAVQQAIDKVFEAQQLKNVEMAKKQASVIEKERIEVEAGAKARQIEILANADAERIRVIAEAAAEAQENPAFITLKRLEVEQERIRKWDGAYPRWMAGGEMPPVIVNPGSIN